jgi:hypothetical protein
MSKLSTSTIAIIDIALAIASVPMGFFLDPSAAFLLAGAAILLGIAGLLRGRKEPPVSTGTWAALGLGALALVVLAVAFAGALFG